MEWFIVAIVAAAALVCPAMMFGRMLLRWLGLRKGADGSSMSCTMISAGESTRINQLDVLRRRRVELDEEIAITKILAAGAARRSHHAEDSKTNTSANGEVRR